MISSPAAIFIAEELSNPIRPARAELYTADGVRPHRSSLATLRWTDFEAIVELSLAEWSKHKAPRLGASLAFYTLLSLAPLLLVLVSVTGLVLGQTEAQTTIVAQVSALVGAQGAKLRASRSYWKAPETPRMASSPRYSES